MITGSFPLKETLSLREQRFYGLAIAGWKDLVLFF